MGATAAIHATIPTPSHNRATNPIEIEDKRQGTDQDPAGIPRGAQHQFHLRRETTISTTSTTRCLAK